MRKDGRKKNGHSRVIKGLRKTNAGVTLDQILCGSPVDPLRTPLELEHNAGVTLDQIPYGSPVDPLRISLELEHKLR